MDYSDRIVDFDTIARISNKLRQDGRVIGFTNGCFDILHAGHVSYLNRAKGLVDVLIVGLNSDASVRRIKGNKRPINPQYDRAVVLASLRSVDFVVVFDEDTPLELIKIIRPDILIKGADWKDKGVVGADVVKSYGGRVEFIEFLDGRSTTGTIERIIDAYCNR
ncbi:D-glycero-beta-D-manno-heptose 1-phosphate adenylyltransferase [Hippea sp. KM1]|uniref:D-glycero-beta-D-manno-heptose 1-phosphate adenylyltransferase n=1 Tax=Hippea sp. KM1 TaxID=944481 RepID=UPI00046D785B|nr:D-glycero-beta-D-manno-heptose 1-phosphate adenylyltransferase [Hippea sp. KM1]